MLLLSRIAARDMVELRDNGFIHKAAWSGETSWGFRVQRYRLLLQ
jgi:hypothetical protein